MLVDVAAQLPFDVDLDAAQLVLVMLVENTFDVLEPMTFRRKSVEDPAFRKLLVLASVIRGIATDDASCDSSHEQVDIEVRRTRLLGSLFLLPLCVPHGFPYSTCVLLLACQSAAQSPSECPAILVAGRDPVNQCWPRGVPRRLCRKPRLRSKRSF
eukprot:scaffold214_cov249-Pinguiococcus_pyrenoidosus.AAC.27